MSDLDADAHQYRLDEIEGLKTDIDRLIAKCFEQHERIEQLEAALRKIACDGDPHFACFCDDPEECSYGIARTALAGEKKDGN